MAFCNHMPRFTVAHAHAFALCTNLLVPCYFGVQLAFDVRLLCEIILHALHSWIPLVQMLRLGFYVVLYRLDFVGFYFIAWCEWAVRGGCRNDGWLRTGIPELTGVFLYVPVSVYSWWKGERESVLRSARIDKLFGNSFLNQLNSLQTSTDSFSAGH